MSGTNNKASTLIGGPFHKDEFELVALYFKARENGAWKVTRKALINWDRLRIVDNESRVGQHGCIAASVPRAN